MKGELPQAQKLKEVYAEWDKVYAEWDRAYAEWSAENEPAILALHKKECVTDCPWDGKTIFGEKK